MPSYIIPAQPKLRPTPPRGSDWLHEVKFDGYRIQLHKHNASVRVLSKNGHDFTDRFPTLTRQLSTLPCRTVILDAEAVVPNAAGVPDFHALHLRRAPAEAYAGWVFDCLHIDDTDLRPQPLKDRRVVLTRLLKRSTGPLLVSEAFSDGAALLAACEARGLEGIVSKKATAAYRSGRCDWIKVKCPTWRARHALRYRMFAESP